VAVISRASKCGRRRCAPRWCYLRVLLAGVTCGDEEPHESHRKRRVMNRRDRSSASRTAREGDARSSPDETDANDATTDARDGADAIWCAKNASCVCSENACSFSFTSLHFLRCSSDVPSVLLLFVSSLSLSHLAPRTVSLPSFLEGLCFFLGLPRVTCTEG